MNRYEDTSKDIFERLFLVSVPMHATISINEMKVFGHVHTGNDHIDRGTIEQYIKVFWPIEKMAETFDQGDPIRILRYNDTKIIYEIVEKHLKRWKDILQNEINIPKAPVDDLIKLDKFAASLFDHAKHLFDDEFVESIFVRSIRSIGSVNQSSVFKKPKRVHISREEGGDAMYDNERVTIGSIEPEDKGPKRESFEDIFKDVKVGGLKWR